MNDFPKNRPDPESTHELEATVILETGLDGKLKSDFADSEATVATADTGLAAAEEAMEPGESEAAQTTAESEPPASKPANLRWDTMFLLLLTCVTLIRVGYLYIVPLDLGPDESYYWDWSRRLDFGSLSTQPLIAWIYAASTALLGISAQAVRMPAILFGAIALIGMYLCGRRIFNAEVAFWSVAAWLATPGAAALGLIMTTDVLLVSCWCLALYCLWRTIEAQKAKTFWWLLTMLLVGLGSLSKLEMVIFPLLMFIYLIFSDDRKHLLRRWPWLLWIGSLLFLIPSLWWNVSNDWLSLKHIAENFPLVGSNPLDDLKSFSLFAGSQLLLITPLTWLLLLLLSFALLLKLLRWTRQTSFLFVFSAVGLLAVTGLSFKQNINPNWTACFYPAGMILLAAWGKEQISAGFFDRMRRWFVPAIKLGVLLTLLAYLLPFALQLNILPLGSQDPTSEYKGWQELGQQVNEVLQQQPRPEQTLILSPLRKYPAEIAFYAPGQPQTYSWPGNPPRVSSQYDPRPGPVDKLGWDALILTDADTPLPGELTAIFENIIELGERSIPIGAAGERRYSLWRGENLLSWPEWN